METTIKQTEFNALALNILMKFNREYLDLPGLRESKKIVYAEITRRKKYNFSQRYKYALMLKILEIILKSRS